MSSSNESKNLQANNQRLLFVTFWITASVFFLLVAFICSKQLIPLPYDIQALIAVSGVAALTILGILLIVMAARARIHKGLRRAFLLAGISAVAMPISAILHNVLYALLIKWFGEDILNKLGSGGDEPFFFILAVIVFPVLFIVSATYGIVTITKRRSKAA